MRDLFRGIDRVRHLRARLYLLPGPRRCLLHRLPLDVTHGVVLVLVRHPSIVTRANERRNSSILSARDSPSVDDDSKTRARRSTEERESECVEFGFRISTAIRDEYSRRRRASRTSRVVTPSRVRVDRLRSVPSVADCRRPAKAARLGGRATRTSRGARGARARDEEGAKLRKCAV